MQIHTVHLTELVIHEFAPLGKKREAQAATERTRHPTRVWGG
jgi:hypothetical protein